jgi:hypothetical protein
MVEQVGNVIGETLVQYSAGEKKRDTTGGEESLLI